MKKELWIAPLLLFLLYLPFSSSLDLAISDHFYASLGGFDQGRHMKAIYNLAILPAWLTAFSSLFFLCYSYQKRRHQDKRRLLWHALLLLPLASGLVINVGFKSCWGRPRPKQVLSYGGKEAYLPVYQPSWQRTSPLKSFPSGHASMGFYFLGLARAAQRDRRKPLSLILLGIGLTLGSLLAYARLAQGGHFFSDILGSLLIVWFCSLGLEYWLWDKKKPDRIGSRSWRV